MCNLIYETPCPIGGVLQIAPRELRRSSASDMVGNQVRPPDKIADLWDLGTNLHVPMFAKFTDQGQKGFAASHPDRFYRVMIAP